MKKQITFSRKAFVGETPAPFRNLSKALLFIAGLWALLHPALPEIPAPAAALIDRCILLSLALLRFVFQFFGYKPQE